jgi:cytidylate kinase
VREKPIIAIDGPVASGKSTCGKKIAQELGFVHLDTGALYRAVGLKAIQSEIDLDDQITIGKMLESTQVSLEPTASGQHTFLDEEDVSEAIRSQEVGAAASAVSKLSEVRCFLLGIQQEMGRQGGIVLDGRDIGTVVFPDAEIKFFLSADPQERARRRFKELREKGIAIEYAAVLKESGERDKADTSRTEAPLTIADDAFRIDSSTKNIEETVAEMIRIIQNKYPDLLAL